MSNRLLSCLFVTLLVPAAVHAQPIATPEQVIFYTQEWQGERFPDGRPRVPDEILERMQHVRLEEAWGTIRGAGYEVKYEGGWHIMHPDQRMVGRALTSAYLPTSPELANRMQTAGSEQGLTGGMNQWPVYMLQQGDVYVADGYGKIEEGTLFGNNIGGAIYTNSGNGAIVYGSARDLDGLRQVEGFNAWVKEWHPSAIGQMMLISVNEPIRIGAAVALPGDVVMAGEGGVLFIPPQLAERVVVASEVERVTDAFRSEAISEGRFTLQQTYGVTWTDEIDNAFYDWMAQERDRINRDLGVGLSTIDQIVQTRSRNWREW